MFLLLCFFCLCVYSREEKYEVQMRRYSEFPLSEEEVKNSVVMNVEGEEYICSFGDVLQGKEEEEEEEEEESSFSQEDQGKVLSDLSQALSGLLGDRCFHLYTRGWWSYQICFKSGTGQLLQFHKSQNKPDEDVEILLGQVKEPFDPKKFTLKQSRKDPEETFLSISLRDGSVCDLTGKSRTSTLRFYCPPRTLKVNTGGGPNPHIMFLSLNEGRSCDYTAKVYLKGLCNFPGFGAPVVEKRGSSKIKCQRSKPLFSEEEKEEVTEEEETEEQESQEKQKVTVSDQGEVGGTRRVIHQGPKKFIMQ